MKYAAVFSCRLKDLMEEKGITSELLGKEIGTSGSTVRAWCEGRYLPYLSHAVKLADFFDCTIDYLMGLENDFIETESRPTEYNFYERVRAVMKEKKVTRYRLTVSTKIKDSHLFNWRAGKNPRIDSVIAVAEYLNVTVEYLVWGDA